MFEVKICGICELSDLAAAAMSGANYVGFVFFDKSRRNLTLDKADKVIKNTPNGISKVALMVNPDDSFLKLVLERVPIDILQLHGRESLTRVSEIKSATGKVVMKAIGVSCRKDLFRVEDYSKVADLILLDAKPPSDSEVPGGLGKSFDWNILKGFELSKPWFLAGGLHSGNVRKAMELTGAKKLDVSSGVEDAFGKKSEKKISEFINTVNGGCNVE